MTPNIEILVHVSAQSRASDDARYHREALGYVNFEAGVRHEVLVHQNQTPTESEPAFLIAQGEGGSFSDAELSPTTSNLSPQSSSRNSLVEQKITVPGKALVSTTGPGRTPEASRASFSHATLSTTPVLNPWTRLSSKSPFVHVEHTPADLRPRSAPTDPSCVQETPCFRRAQSDSWETPPSVIPDSQPSPLHLKRPLTSSSPSPNHRSNSRSPKRQRRQSSSPPVETSSQSCYSSPASASLSLQPQRSCTPSVRPTAEVSRSPLSESAFVPIATVLAIYAPPPQPSTEPFETYITPYLKILVNHLPLAIFFIPQQLQPPARALQVHERGHWAFPIPPFPAGEWQKFWSYLETFIRTGRASFGVSCVVEGRRRGGAGGSCEIGGAPVKQVGEPEVTERHRGRESEAGRSDEATADVENTKPGPVDAAWMPSVEKPLMKFYCWGEIVPHIWLLLFTASHRRVKGCGVQWIDSRGEVVIQMK